MNSLMKLGLKVWSATLRFAIQTNRRTVLDRFGLARLTVTSSCSLVLAKLSFVLIIYVLASCNCAALLSSNMVCRFRAQNLRIYYSMHMVDIGINA